MTEAEKLAGDINKVRSSCGPALIAMLVGVVVCVICIGVSV